MRLSPCVVGVDVQRDGRGGRPDALRLHTQVAAGLPALQSHQVHQGIHLQCGERACLSACLSVCLSRCLSVLLSVSLPVSLSACELVAVFFHLSLYLPFCYIQFCLTHYLFLFLFLFLSLSLSLSVSLSFCLSLFLSFFLSLSLSLSLTSSRNSLFACHVSVLAVWAKRMCVCVRVCVRVCV